MKIPKLEILVFSCKPFSLFTSFKFRHGMSTNMPEVADLHSWFQPMTKLEIVDAVDNGKSRARDCLHALSLAEANYDNMRYYGGLIVFF